MIKNKIVIAELLVVLLILPSFILIGGKTTTSGVEIIIQGGIGWKFRINNPTSQEVMAFYDAEATGILFGRTALDVHGKTNCPPDMDIGRKQTSFLTTVPLARITVTVECAGQTATRSGLMICSAFVIFLS